MSDKKHKGIARSSFARSLAVSLAGARAGGALALDGALQKLRGESAAADSDFAKREAKRFVQELGKLKGSYVKIGQMLALLGEHFLPPVLTEALHELEAGTQPLPWSLLQEGLRESLGERLDELRIEQKALAAASLAQVHRAKIIATGEEIVLKIQYPGLAEVIDADFDAVVRMLILARWVKAGRDMDGWMESMREQLHLEIDYQREADMTERVAALAAAGSAAQGGVKYHVPEVYRRFSGDKVLALEFIQGHAVTRSEIAQLSQTRRNALGRSMLELFFRELYQWGILQTDPNFGNYMIRLNSGGDAKAGDELVLLDFGSALECEETFLRHLGNTIAAGQNNDRALMIKSLIGLGCLRSDSPPEASESFSNFCLRLLEPLRPPEELPAEYCNSKGEYDWGRSQLLRRMGKKAASSASSRHFAAPSRDFTLIARKLTGVFTFIAVLNAEFNAHGWVSEFLADWQTQHR